MAGLERLRPGDGRSSLKQATRRALARRRRPARGSRRLQGRGALDQQPSGRHRRRSSSSSAPPRRPSASSGATSARSTGCRTAKVGDRAVDDPLPFWLHDARTAPLVRPLGQPVAARPRRPGRARRPAERRSRARPSSRSSTRSGYAAGRWRVELGPDGGSAAPTTAMRRRDAVRLGARAPRSSAATRSRGWRRPATCDEERPGGARPRVSRALRRRRPPRWSPARLLTERRRTRRGAGRPRRGGGRPGACTAASASHSACVVGGPEQPAAVGHLGHLHAERAARAPRRRPGPPRPTPRPAPRTAGSRAARAGARSASATRVGVAVHGGLHHLVVGQPGLEQQATGRPAAGRARPGRHPRRAGHEGERLLGGPVARRQQLLVEVEEGHHVGPVDPLQHRLGADHDPGVGHGGRPMPR